MQVIILGLLLSFVYFFIGAIWYSSFLFGNMWQKEVNKSKKIPKSSQMFFLMGATFICIAIMILSILYLGKPLPVFTWLKKKAQRFLIIIPIVISASSINSLYEGKSLNLWLINSGYTAAGLSAVALLCHFFV